MTDDVFNEHRSTLIAVAYRILGSRTEAEDIVQEAWLRWHSAMRRQVSVSNHRAYLIQIVTRLAIDQLRSATARRETYVGPWLPEPTTDTVGSGGVDDPVDAMNRMDTASVGLLVVLESLSPLERAVFVLREAFELPYADIAHALDKSESAVRQLAKRSREHVAERRARYDRDPAVHREAIERFMAATLSGDVAELMRLLAPDATVVVDSAGKVRGIPKPVHGADKVARFFAGASTRAPQDMAVLYRDVNGEPCVVTTSATDGKTVLSMELVDGKISQIYWIANPDKLAHVDP